MEINQNTKLKELASYLRTDFGIGIYDGQKGDLPHSTTLLLDPFLRDKTNLQKWKPIRLTQSTTIGELQKFLVSFCRIHAEFRNKLGIKLEHNVSLEEAITLEYSALSNTDNISTTLNSAISLIKENPSFHEYDWTYRVLRQAAQKVTTNHEKTLMITALIEVCEHSPKLSIPRLVEIIKIFSKPESDYKTISEQLSASQSSTAKELATALLN